MSIIANTTWRRYTRRVYRRSLFETQIKGMLERNRIKLLFGCYRMLHPAEWLLVTGRHERQEAGHFFQVHVEI